MFGDMLVAAQQGGRRRRKASYAAATAALERTGIAVEADAPAGGLGLLAREPLAISHTLAATRPSMDCLTRSPTDDRPRGHRPGRDRPRDRPPRAPVVWIERVVRALTSLVSRMTSSAAGDRRRLAPRPRCWPTPGARDLLRHQTRPVDNTSSTDQKRRDRTHRVSETDPAGARPARCSRSAILVVHHRADSRRCRHLAGGVPGRGYAASSARTEPADGALLRTIAGSAPPRTEGTNG